jgi:ankyrin repeat protein
MDIKSRIMILAIDERSMNIITYMIENNIISIDQDLYLGSTAIYLALLRGDIKIIKYLLSKNPNPYKKNQFDMDCFDRLKEEKRSFVMGFKPLMKNVNEIFKLFEEKYQCQLT